MIPNDEEARKRRHRIERIIATSLVAVLAFVVAVFVRWNSHEKAAIRRDLRYIPKVDRMTPEIQLLQAYVRIDTSTDEGETAGARWLASQLEKRGIHAELIESGGRLNVYARIRGEAKDGGLLLFNHIDVVPANPAEWQFPPYSGEISANQLWGRGTIDMKALAICQLLALEQIVRSGRTPRHDLVFLATADEETGSSRGMRWLLANRKDVFAGVQYGITEGGITEVISETMTYFGIEIGGKQTMRLALEGKSLESMRAARIALEPQLLKYEPEHVLPEVKRFFAALAPTRTAFRPLLADIDVAIREGRFWRLPIAYRDLTQTRLWVSAPRQTESGAAMDIAVSLLPDEDPATRVATLQKQVTTYGVTVKAVSTLEGPVPLSKETTPLFELLAKKARARFQVTAGPEILYTSTTDSRFLRRAGIISYGLCPYPVNFFQSVSIHKANERIRLDWFLDGNAYMKEVVEEWAFHASQ
jgi:acetylornithine deacetylase/succinyl-diaminopimelate desuccinylase-like protein